MYLWPGKVPGLTKLWLIKMTRLQLFPNATERDDLPFTERMALMQLFKKQPRPLQDAGTTNAGKETKSSDSGE